ncbi:acyltransferase family protein [Pseudonocardia acidicola]|uniref:Acyltransferase n=1 Tax=Pseudonocardia acidicola TaxID=2724939 RepID=A0ABX1S6A5_9PSEU|nr:acyltransferase family protein [Pseudonocardia acidicola]NMH97101.1 acyltransferase [Pseudonocardia acidicola]
MTQVPPTASGSPATALHAGTGERRFRPELQGLRALAVTLVVIYHVWFDRISGGVDVFFLISGFLITGQLVRAAERGPIRFRAMWGRQITRLFPAALTVLLATVIAGMFLLPEARWLQTVREVVASVFFLENWRLAAASVDYAAQHNTASVVQHFWSLSIQVQFYVVWPLLVALVALVAREARDRLRGYLTVTLIGVLVASLSFSVALTITNQPLAYFHSLTRAWEFALGGLLALVINAIVLARRVRIAIGWIGVIGLLSCGMVLQVGRIFPGYAALWPTVCAGLVILAGATGSAHGVDRVLSSRSMHHLGDVSYALYLWHWPVLLFFLVVSGQATVGPGAGAVIIAISLVLAVLTYHLVEEPVRRASFGIRAQYRLGALSMAVVLLAAGIWQFAAGQRAHDLSAAGDADHPGAVARLDGFSYAGRTDAPLVPPMVTVTEDWAQKAGAWDCAASAHDTELEVCSQAMPAPPERRIVVVGDSHAQQYIAALEPIAAKRNWQLISMLRGACPFSTVSETDPVNEGCVQWNAAAADEIADLRPDAVFTLATRDVRAGLTEQTPPGFVEQWRRMNDLGIRVIAVRDNPRFDFSPPDCIQQHGRGAPECGIARDAVFSPVAPYAQIPDVPPNVSFLDFTDYLCDDRFCPAEIGNVLVYMDFNHLTATYLTSMAPFVEQELNAALGW